MYEKEAIVLRITSFYGRIVLTEGYKGNIEIKIKGDFL